MTTLMFIFITKMYIYLRKTPDGNSREHIKRDNMNKKKNRAAFFNVKTLSVNA